MMFRAAVLLTVALCARVASGDPLERAENLRPTQPWIADAIAYGTRASPTMARLVAEVASVSMIVHIEEAKGPRQGWDGRIRFGAASGPWLYLRIEVRRHEAPAAAAIIAHELQHALEAHAGGVRSVAEFEAMYRRIGVRIAADDEKYDTLAARAAGRRTLRELCTPALASRLAGPSQLRRCDALCAAPGCVAPGRR